MDPLPRGVRLRDIAVVVVPPMPCGVIGTVISTVIAGVIAGVSAAVLLHVVVLTAGVYGMYAVLERLDRRAQIALGLGVTLVAAVAFSYGVVDSFS